MLIAVRLYFRKITIRNRDLVPAEGPIIFAPNHPGAFLDPIVVSVLVKHELHFLARGESFGTALARTVYGWLNMIPIYRPNESPDEVHKNDQIFEKCYEHLAKKRSIIIFPEGISHTEPRLKKVKTGAARIGLGAGAYSEEDLDIKIVPIGLNYTAAHSFRSELFLNFGQPISLKEYQEQYQTDEFEGVRSLTTRIREELEARVVVIRNEDLDDLIADIEVMYRSHLQEVLDTNDEGASRKFRIAREIAEAVQHFQRVDPLRVTNFRERLNEYRYRLTGLSLDDRQVRSAERRWPMAAILLFLVFGAPLFAVGALWNYLPYRLTGWIVDKVVKRDDFIGAVRILAGFGVFLVYYTGLVILASFWLPWFLTLAFLLSLPLTGLFALAWIKRVILLKSVSAFRSIFRRRKGEINALKELREDLIKELETARDQYLQVKEDVLLKEDSGL